MPDGALASPAARGDFGPEGASARPRGRRPFSREEWVIPGWTLSKHLTRTLAIAAGLAALGGWLVAGGAWWVWLAVPPFWLVANVFEWWMHRYPMHRPMTPRVLYKNHAKVHHPAFDGTAQEIRHPHELSLVMMPWYTLLLVFMFASPIAIAAAFIGGGALAGVFLLSSVAYFLLYELIHTVHHLPMAVLERSWWGRHPLLAAMRRRHHSHHQRDRMTEVNFNVTFAFADRLMGTYIKP